MPFKKIFKKPPLETNVLIEESNRFSIPWWKWFQDIWYFLDRLFPAGNEEQTVWDDLRAPATTVRIPGIQDPDYDAGNVGLRFDKNLTERVDAIFQLAHTYKHGTNIVPHVHWQPTTDGDTGNVVWSIEYTWANPVGDITDASASFTQVDVTDQCSGNIRETHIASFGNIVGTGMIGSSVFKTKLTRIGGATPDTYDADALFEELDVHYQIDKLGSENQTPS